MFLVLSFIFFSIRKQKSKAGSVVGGWQLASVVEG
jgi:hypothetical protein